MARPKASVPEILVTHDGADFDGFAALVAGQKLYPGARLVLGAATSPDLGAFLALHRDRFPTLAASDVDAAALARVVLVDVRRAGRLKTLGAIADRLARRDAALDVHVYDHHPSAPDDVRGSVEVIAPVGSATTLLVEEIRRRGLPVDPLEATLMALGVHADTGSLTYAGTTPRDAAALSALMGWGVALPVLNRYLAMGLDRAQREILRRALGAAVVRRIGGVDVALLSLELDEDTSGLDEVTSHVAALESRAAIFAVFAAPKGRVHVVARARAPWIDVGRVLAAVGGGGHPAAASVTRKGESADAIVAAIVAAIEADPPRPSRVRDLMSSPVHTVAPAATLRELAATLGAWRHTGAPVVEEGRLVGVVSRRDVEAADAAGDLDRPVASRMRRRVVTTTPDAPLDDALALMQAEDVGRLPVLDAGRLAGIVTRSDVLRALYAEAKAPPGA